MDQKTNEILNRRYSIVPPAHSSFLTVWHSRFPENFLATNSSAKLDPPFHPFPTFSDDGPDGTLNFLPFLQPPTLSHPANRLPSSAAIHQKSFWGKDQLILSHSSSSIWLIPRLPSIHPPKIPSFIPALFVLPLVFIRKPAHQQPIRRCFPMQFSFRLIVGCHLVFFQSRRTFTSSTQPTQFLDRPIPSHRSTPWGMG